MSIWLAAAMTSATSNDGDARDDDAHDDDTYSSINDEGDATASHDTDGTQPGTSDTEMHGTCHV